MKDCREKRCQEWHGFWPDNTVEDGVPSEHENRTRSGRSGFGVFETPKDVKRAEGRTGLVKEMWCTNSYKTRQEALKALGEVDVKVCGIS